MFRRFGLVSLKKSQAWKISWSSLGMPRERAALGAAIPGKGAPNSPFLIPPGQDRLRNPDCPWGMCPALSPGDPVKTQVFSGVPTRIFPFPPGFGSAPCPCYWGEYCQVPWDGPERKVAGKEMMEGMMERRDGNSVLDVPSCARRPTKNPA